MKSGEFTLQSFDPPVIFTGELGDQAPVPTDDSYGGLVITPVPKRIGLTEYEGQNPMGLTIDFYVDRLNDIDDGYVAHQFRTLERIAGRIPDEDYEPLIVQLNGQGRIPHDITRNPHATWQVETLSWDRDLILNGDNGPLRIGGTIQLREVTADDVLGDYNGPASKNRRKHKPHRKGKGKGHHNRGATYVVKDGDTLISIASRVLGDSKRWREIADLNNLRHPRHDLKTGMRLRMPK